MPNLDIKSKGPNYTTIYLPYLPPLPKSLSLITFKTPYSIPIFKIKAYKVIAYVPYPYYNPKAVKEITLS